MEDHDAFVIMFGILFSVFFTWKLSDVSTGYQFGLSFFTLLIGNRIAFARFIGFIIFVGVSVGLLYFVLPKIKFCKNFWGMVQTFVFSAIPIGVFHLAKGLYVVMAFYFGLEQFLNSQDVVVDDRALIIEHFVSFSRDELISLSWLKSIPNVSLLLFSLYMIVFLVAYVRAR